MLIELADKLIESASGGKFGVEKNPKFSEIMSRISLENRNLMTRIYDAGTLMIIDDQDFDIVFRYNFVKKK